MNPSDLAAFRSKSYPYDNDFCYLDDDPIDIILGALIS